MRGPIALALGFGFARKGLEDKATLAEYGIQDGSSIHAV